MKKMTSKFIWLVVLFAPINGKGNEPRKVRHRTKNHDFIKKSNKGYHDIDPDHDEVPDSQEENRVRAVIAPYFGKVSKLDNLCNKLSNSYGVNFCELESGWGRRNPNGRLLAGEKHEEYENSSYDLVSKEESHMIKSFRGTNLKERRHLATCHIYEHHYYSKYNQKDTYFQKTLHFLVADPEFDLTEDLENPMDALDHFNYCTDDMTDFEFKADYIDVDVSGMNWMKATEEVMNKAVDMGIADFDRTEVNGGNNDKYTFNTGEHMTMIIMPNDVDFKGAYGFAALHYGLSIIRSDATKKEKYVLHEIGHNLGMKHSSTPEDEYGDDRCLMGNAKRNSCFNGPKSYYLGLYMDYTAVIKKEMSCSVMLKIADIHAHLSDKSVLWQTHGQYYVVAVAKIPIGEKMKRVYMMYHEEDDIITVTIGSLGDIRTEDGDRLLFSDISTRVVDIDAYGSFVYESGVLIKRCPSSDVSVASVLISFDLHGSNECY